MMGWKTVLSAAKSPTHILTLTVTLTYLALLVLTVFKQREVALYLRSTRKAQSERSRVSVLLSQAPQTMTNTEIPPSPHANTHT